MLVMAGKVAGYFMPSASIFLQTVINAPIAMQWLFGFAALVAVREQRCRYDQLTKVQGLQTVVGDTGEED